MDIVATLVTLWLIIITAAVIVYFFLVFERKRGAYQSLKSKNTQPLMVRAAPVKKVRHPGRIGGAPTIFSILTGDRDVS